MKYEDALKILDDCTDEHRQAFKAQWGFLCELSLKGRRWLVCGACRDKHHAAWKQARKEELAAYNAALPRCDRCGVRPFKWTLAQFQLCGKCKTQTQREHNQRVAQSGGLAIFVQGLLVDTTSWAFNKAH